jgi:hypothetical protein
MASIHSTQKWTPLGYAQATVTNVALGFSGLGIAIPTDTVMVEISTEVALRWRDDGTPPTASVGMPLYNGQQFQYTVPDFTLIQFITQTGVANGLINVSFYK